MTKAIMMDEDAPDMYNSGLWLPDFKSANYPGIDYHTCRNFSSSMLFNFVLYFAFLTFFYLSFTDESFVDEPRGMHKYEISILLLMMSLFTCSRVQC